ncbi:hypothetical protein M6D93_18830 [Jatrophihabitans telluris]|uniref:Uncharacterized protein n=1 Tax=Jatrophihabitans telluris TaxID=2038343 RepID=A0ABY4QXQ2_9ACTN|nr:hypothetical protein [Jatrophihabitans telluris]UQX88315.1 hypothetical protein M6D93_18830 [Jatrophihabitans telluris]
MDAAPVLVEPVLVEPVLVDPVLVEPVLVEPVLVELDALADPVAVSLGLLLVGAALEVVPEVVPVVDAPDPLAFWVAAACSTNKPNAAALAAMTPPMASLMRRLSETGECPELFMAQLSDDVF